MQTLVIFDDVSTELPADAALIMEHVKQARVRGRVLYLGSPWPDKGVFSQFKEGGDVSPVSTT